MQPLFSVLLSLQLYTGKSATEIQPALREEKLESDYKWLPDWQKMCCFKSENGSESSELDNIVYYHILEVKNSTWVASKSDWTT